MTAEGSLHIEAIWNGSAVTAAAVRSSRPLQASRLLLGKAVQGAVDAVPLLFSVCGRAQGVAAVAAAEAAFGAAVSDSVREARRRLILCEIIHEYLWRVLIDQPLLAAGHPHVQAMAAMRVNLTGMQKPLLAAGGWKTVGGSDVADADGAWTAFLETLKDFLHRDVLGCKPGQWLALDTSDALDAWSAGTQAPAATALHGFARSGRFGAGSVALMSQPDETWLREAAEAMRDERFAQRPEWRGAPLETGALARQRRHPLLQALTVADGGSVFARSVARLIELARIASADGNTSWFGSLSLGDGAGLGWVETARGLLMHRVVIDDGRVLQYRIVAPTEWNFHENGALVRGLRGMAAASEEDARSRAQWLVQSLDPCVACEVTVRHA
jgi:hypothetical protein